MDTDNIESILVVLGSFTLLSDDKTVWKEIYDRVNDTKYWEIHGSILKTVKNVSTRNSAVMWRDLVDEMIDLVKELNRRTRISGDVYFIYNNFENSLSESRKFTKTVDEDVLREFTGEYVFRFNHHL